MPSELDPQLVDAVEANDGARVLELLGKGADPNARKTLVQVQRVAVGRRQVKSGSPFSDPRYEDVVETKEASTPAESALGLAIMHGYPQVVETLLAAGADHSRKIEWPIADTWNEAGVATKEWWESRRTRVTFTVRSALSLALGRAGRATARDGSPLGWFTDIESKGLFRVNRPGGVVRLENIRQFASVSIELVVKPNVDVVQSLLRHGAAVSSGHVALAARHARSVLDLLEARVRESDNISLAPSSIHAAGTTSSAISTTGGNGSLNATRRASFAPSVGPPDDPSPDLIAALEAGNHSLVSKALSAGADPRARKTVTLSQRVIVGRQPNPSLLGADQDVVDVRTDTAACEPALALAILHGDANSVRALLSAGADPEAQLDWFIPATWLGGAPWSLDWWRHRRWYFKWTFSSALLMALGKVESGSLWDGSASSWTADLDARGLVRVNKPGARVQLSNPTSWGAVCDTASLTPRTDVVAALLAGGAVVTEAAIAAAGGLQDKQILQALEFERSKPPATVAVTAAPVSLFTAPTRPGDSPGTSEQKPLVSPSDVAGGQLHLPAGQRALYPEVGGQVSGASAKTGLWGAFPMSALSPMPHFSPAASPSASFPAPSAPPAPDDLPRDTQGPVSQDGTLSIRLAELQATVSQLEQDKSGLQAALSHLRQEKSSLEATVSQLQTDRSAILAELSAARAHAARLEYELARSREDARRARGESAGMQARVASLDREVAALRYQVAVGSGGLNAEAAGPVDVNTVMFVVHGYDPQDADEIALRPGQQVFCNVRMSDGWGKGMNVVSGASGFFPMACLSFTADMPASPPYLGARTTSLAVALPPPAHAPAAVRASSRAESLAPPAAGAAARQLAGGERAQAPASAFPGFVVDVKGPAAHEDGTRG